MKIVINYYWNYFLDNIRLLSILKQISKSKLSDLCSSFFFYNIKVSINIVKITIFKVLYVLIIGNCISMK